MKRLDKTERQQQLARLFAENPFTTDEELAKKFSVSVQTIRLDRMELNIPELRERTKRVAKQVFNKVRSMTGNELVGELLELELGLSASSILVVTPDMVAEKSQVCKMCIRDRFNVE